MYGAILGDIIGSPYEFDDYNYKATEKFIEKVSSEDEKTINNTSDNTDIATYKISHRTAQKGYSMTDILMFSGVLLVSYFDVFSEILQIPFCKNDFLGFFLKKGKNDTLNDFP